MFLLLLQGFPICLVKTFLVLVSALDGLIIEEDVKPTVIICFVYLVTMKHLVVIITSLLLKTDGIVMSW